MFTCRPAGRASGARRPRTEDHTPTLFATPNRTRWWHQLTVTRCSAARLDQHAWLVGRRDRPSTSTSPSDAYSWTHAGDDHAVQRIRTGSFPHPTQPCTTTTTRRSSPCTCAGHPRPPRTRRYRAHPRRVLCDRLPLPRRWWRSGDELPGQVVEHRGVEPVLVAGRSRHLRYPVEPVCERDALEQPVALGRGASHRTRVRSHYRGLPSVRTLLGGR